MNQPVSDDARRLPEGSEDLGLSASWLSAMARTHRFVLTYSRELA